jgi:glycosyltransferase involved in cell wall biosynthesis
MTFGAPLIGTDAEPLVAAIIPAFNASRTIDATLCSVRHQTHRALDIVVIDDGSTDATCEIVARHAAEDPRVRLIRQANGGVAAARNAGLQATIAQFVAPIDADDLWHPEKIARQLEVFRAGGPNIGLVYTWSVWVDEMGRVMSYGERSVVEGDVLKRLCRRNVVGNGSSAMMLRQAVIGAGGYDTELRRQRAQGCEDLKLCIRIAEKYHFGVVREFLTGYRQVTPSMSSDVLQMARSWHSVRHEILHRRPDLAADLARGTIGITAWLQGRARAAGREADARRLMLDLLRREPGLAVRMLAGPQWYAVKLWLGFERTAADGSADGPLGVPFLGPLS